LGETFSKKKLASRIHFGKTDVLMHGDSRQRQHLSLETSVSRGVKTYVFVAVHNAGRWFRGRVQW